MCLAVPMRITTLEDERRGTVELEGTEYPVDLTLVDAPRVGEYVIVHAGCAIDKFDAAEADERLALFAELAACYRDELERGSGGG